MSTSISEVFQYVNLKSLNGSVNTYELTDLQEQLMDQGHTILGLKLDVILRMRRELMKAGMPIDPSVGDVQAFFDYLKRKGVLADASSEDTE